MTTAPVPPTSRYAGLEVAVHLDPDGRATPYLRRRFCPDPDQLAPLTEHVVAGGDRLDRIAAEHLGDPEQFWQVADANRALWVEALTARPGRRLRITRPAGFPGLPTPGGPR
ncbi:LysM peptidoglycan-binding domain-containing protein [Nocardioides sp. GY 10113]|uniref:LysM peptidoglycan-binding domain-containing protein n=1 Tax=Nocardioides sp. GY 10113 TaxID=2569761 RepID=UPI0010A926F9|nr:LysM domain-containing protein [Nocardioides sp. GY 10113]TIC88293.1 LysM peptidoglycan-binding domain-containing protein [Nocardioides sp. GY 10113]